MFPWNQVNICDQCDFITNDKLKLRNHIKLKHEGFGFACDSCEYVGSSKLLLASHVNHRHMGVKFKVGLDFFSLNMIFFLLLVCFYSLYSNKIYVLTEKHPFLHFCRVYFPENREVNSSLLRFKTTNINNIKNRENLPFFKYY